MTQREAGPPPESTGRPVGDGQDRASPRFTVVVPAYNAVRTLGATVRSVLNQTERDLEVVIVDDGSTDSTGVLARSFEDPRVVVHSQANTGLPGARNAGLRIAQGEIVCFLDSDDLLLPSYLATVQASFTHEPEAGFVYADAWTFDDRTRRVRVHTTTHYVRPPGPVPKTAHAMFLTLLKTNFIIIPVAVRRTLIVALGGFDSLMTSAEDWDMWLRLTVAGHRGVQAPGPLGLRREHSAQMTNNFARMTAGQVHALEKLLDNPELRAEDAEPVRDELERNRAYLRTLTGEDRLGALKLRLRWGLGAARRGAGLGARFYRDPPEPVRAAFGDLADV